MELTHWSLCSYEVDLGLGKVPSVDITVFEFLSGAKFVALDILVVKNVHFRKISWTEEVKRTHGWVLKYEG